MSNDNTSKIITVEIANAYGRELIRPICNAAKMFAELGSTKTLTRGQIDLIRGLGYTVLVNQPVVSL